MAKVIRTGIQVELTEEEEKAFEKVLNVLDKLRFEEGMDAWASSITDSGCGVEEIYCDLFNIYNVCI